MENLNTRLVEVKEVLRKKKKLEEHLDRAEKYLNEEQEKAKELQRLLLKEKEDVKRLEIFSLTNIFYTIAGRKLEKLDKEQQEVIAAKLKFKEAEETIQDLGKEINTYYNELQSLGDVENEYQQILREKERLIHDQESYWSTELFSVSEEAINLEGALKEYNEAIQAGNRSLRGLQFALDSLSKAKNWSTFDMFGGGMITTAIKHGHLDDAKGAIHEAQQQLRHFQEELLDIKNHFHIDLDIGNMLTFADYFFNSLIVDWAVHGKITDSYEQTNKMYQRVEETLESLHKDKKDIEYKVDDAKKRRIEILERSYLK